MRRFVYRPLRPLAAALAAACAAPAAPSPPAAEFLVAAADSTYWVASGRGGVQLRGAPLTIASAGGRFYELFVADDDRSYYDAVLVGQRLYRRDLLTGDSAVVFADSVVPRLARGYAAAHPAEDPLAADDEPSDDPALVANAEVAVVAVHGPYATYDYHTDVERAGSAPRSVMHRGVLDWRTGRAASLATLFGPTDGAAIAAAGRRLYAAAVDSVRRSRDPRAADARAALGGLRFDERRFAIDVVDGRPAVAFDVVGVGTRAGGVTLPLAPVAAPRPPAWWGDAAAALAAPAVGDGADLWPGPGYLVRAAYLGDSAAALAIVDSTRRSWPAGRVQPTVARVLRLDRPPIDRATRGALQRAFDESALYDERARLVDRRGRASRRPGRVRLVSAPRRPPR